MFAVWEVNNNSIAINSSVTSWTVRMAWVGEPGGGGMNGMMINDGRCERYEQYDAAILH